MNAILSIKPEFVEKILSGEKVYEFRKSIFRKEINKVLIYSTMPVGKLIGEFKLNHVISGNKEHVWKVTKDKSGISFDFYCDYYASKDVAYALKIDELKVYEKPINPFISIPNFVAPQSYRYIEEHR